MASTPARLQDLPPKGGYNPITFKRIPAKSYFRGSTLILGYIGVTTVATYLYFLSWKKVRQEEIELRSSRLALYPMLLAERDRAFLLQLRKNRDEEAELMANVPGWVVGTWYGEPIYKTLPPDTLVAPRMKEFYVHAPERDFNKRLMFKLWT